MNEVWADTNVLLRLITGDPPAMLEEVRGLADRASRGEVTLRVSPVVVSEAAWALKSLYRYPRDAVAEGLASLLAAEGVSVEDEPLVYRALRDMAQKNVAFVDAFLAAHATAAGQPVCTFDADFDRLAVEALRPRDVK